MARGDVARLGRPTAGAGKRAAPAGRPDASSQAGRSGHDACCVHSCAEMSISSWKSASISISMSTRESRAPSPASSLTVSSPHRSSVSGEAAGVPARTDSRYRMLAVGMAIKGCTPLRRTARRSIPLVAASCIRTNVLPRPSRRQQRLANGPEVCRCFANVRPPRNQSCDPASLHLCNIEYWIRRADLERYACSCPSGEFRRDEESRHLVCRIARGRPDWRAVLVARSARERLGPATPASRGRVRTRGPGADADASECANRPASRACGRRARCRRRARVR
jgi:hypothetical protein